MTTTAHIAIQEARVNFVSQTGLVDHSTDGTVTSDHGAIDPDGTWWPDLVEVTWDDDGEIDILSIDDVCIAGSM
jgi:hypothetical protein